MKREQILAWMKREAEEGYKNFSASLLPEVPKERILGVRLPKLRKLAAVIVKEGCQEYLAEEPGCLFEEVMLRGMVIGADGGSFEKTAGRIRDFLPYIDNWSVCDSFCSSLKGTKEYPEKMWPFLLECLQSGETYTIRFALVMMLQYYVSEKYRKQALDLLEHMRSGEYYVRMAAAWAVSIYYIHFPEEVMEWLEHRGLEEDVWRKALQKILESRRVSPEEKDKIRKLRARGRRQ